MHEAAFGAPPGDQFRGSRWEAEQTQGVRRFDKWRILEH